ncbi:hypothetical protein [Cupriavidus necator]|uniref:hypothetical protein n=1 Tax=Cupriavidus necator TaxID=106590 RepID=UPI0005B5280D|nr:hypothetical protein [Cupriavidus necator]
MDDVDRIFYLIPKRRGDGENIDLFLPGDLVAQEDGKIAPLGFGIFTFLRNACNRGKPRYLSFRAVIGFGEDSRIVDLTLQSDYIKTRTGNTNRFSFVEDATTRQLGIEASFAARKFPPPFQLAGAAAKLSGHSLWALIPEDREHLETLWAQRAFYLIGHGALDESRDVSNG